MDNYSVQYKDFGSSFIDLFTNRNKKYEKFNDYKIDKFIKQKEFNYYLENPEELPSDKVVLYRQKGKKFEYCIATITEYGKMSKNEKIDIILNEYNKVLREFDYNRTDLINTYENLGYGLGEALFQASSNSSIQEFVGNYILYNLDNLTELLHGDIDTINNIRDLKYLENKLKYVMENY